MLLKNGIVKVGNVNNVDFQSKIIFFVDKKDMIKYQQINEIKLVQKIHCSEVIEYEELSWGFIDLLKK